MIKIMMLYSIEINYVKVNIKEEIMNMLDSY